MDSIKSELIFGNYQLKNAFRYLAEHFNKNDKLELLINKECLNENKKHVLLPKIQLRHVNSVIIVS